MQEKEIVLSTKGITKTYHTGKVSTAALNGVDVELKKGEMVAVMGSSGSGKSTLLNIIGALDSPDEGEIYINNEHMENYHEEPFATEYRSKNIGFIFQSYNLLKDLTVEDNIALPLILRDVEKNETEEKVKEMMKALGLAGMGSKRTIELSGGQQQRVAIARALITNPAVLLADEPTGNLDYNTSAEILNLIKAMQKKLNQSIIIVTHDPVVATYADRVIFMHDGKIRGQYENTFEHGNLDDIMFKFRSYLEVKND